MALHQQRLKKYKSYICILHLQGCSVNQQYWNSLGKEWELSVSAVNGAKEACSRQPEGQDVLHYSPQPVKTYQKSNFAHGSQCSIAMIIYDHRLQWFSEKLSEREFIVKESK